MLETKRIEDAISDFLRYLELVRNYSPNTIKSYRSDLRDALDVLRSLSAQTDLFVEQLTPALLRSYLAQLSRREISAATIVRKITAMRSFCRWLVRQGRLHENPATGLRGPRCVRPLPRFMSYDDVSKLLSAPDATRGFGCRDLSILHFFYSSGIRVSELTALNLEDLDINDGLVKVRSGKGQRDRFAIIGPPAIQAASQWLAFRARMAGTIAVDPSALYLNCDGNRLTTRSVLRIFRSYADKAKLTTHYTLHGIRHTFASHLLANRASLPEIKELLGHQNLQTTCIYSHVSPPRLRQVLEDKHPRA